MLSFRRLLYLADDPARMARQWSPEPDPSTSAEWVAQLRDNVSTDEITPLPCMVHFDATLGRHVYTGFTTQGERPIGLGRVQAAGFEVVVAGERYGKGSSREHSVVAERAAGVRLVIAKSFERIYRQNADNLGLWTSTDLSLIDRILRGESITEDELLVGRDPLTQAVLRRGGLLAFGQDLAHLRESIPTPTPGPVAKPQTLFEKIVERHGVATPVTLAPRAVGEGGFVQPDWRFIHEYYTGMAGWLLEGAYGQGLKLRDGHSIVAFEDHLSYVHRSPAHVQQGLVSSVLGLSRAHRALVQRFGLRHHGYVRGELDAGHADNEGSEGISHAMMAERYALPGQLIAGTDSHTTHSGALGCVAFGVGTTDMANAMVTGLVRMTMPASLRINVLTPLSAGVTAKDLVLHLLALPSLRRGDGVGKVFEFGGPGVRALGIDERATLCNMVAELGGFTGLVEPDATTQEFILERRGVHVDIEPWMRSDAGATYVGQIDVHGADIEPLLARPGDPGLGVSVRALQQEVPQGVRIDIAYGGSCTAGKREDFDHYHAVLAWAVERGLRVAPHVKLYLQYGTEDVRHYCESRGYLATFEQVGAELLRAACGACANGGPGASTRREQVTISAINRNFPGRSGPGQVWLASPPTVVASAIAGRIASFAELQRQWGERVS